MSGHILFCGVHFDARPQGINSARLVRAMLDIGLQITVLCGAEKSVTTRLSHPNLSLVPIRIAPRHPRKLLQWLAQARGHLPCNHYLWSQRVARYRPARPVDVVYGRAWPYSSLVGAANIADALDLPLWIHLCDPIPPPHTGRDHDYVMQGLAQIALKARGATMLNDRALAYQLKFLPPRPEGWAQVVNNIAPPPSTFGPAQTDQCFVYIGSFSASRPADALFAGFAEYARAQPAARIHCVGTGVDNVRPAARRCGVEAQIVVEPFTRDIAGWQAKASVLLAVDWLVGEPVFMLTKLLESFVVDRPVLLLTQPDSPGARLASQFPDTVVCVTSSDPQSVAEGFARAAQMLRSPGDYAARLRGMEAFSAQRVARRCASLLLGRSLD